MEKIGSILKAAREKRKMSLEDVVKATKIKTPFIEALEKNEFNKLIAPIYARGFIKLYAQCVKIDPAPLLRQFTALKAASQPVPARQKLPEKKNAVSIKFNWNINIIYARLLGVFNRIKLPDIRKIRIPTIPTIPAIPAFKPIEMPVKKLLIITATAVICVIVISIFIKRIAVSNATLKVPQTCRWIADPPEPYINIPIQKSTSSR
ncbi:helix-turn-helix domain-containing protein [Verrucomicrobiota bacterium]